MDRSGRVTGFSLVELLMVLTVAGILAAFALPAFNGMIQNGRRTATVNELMTGLLLARTEATKRGQAISIAGSPGGTDWRQGWTIFVDANADGVMAAAGDRLRSYANTHPLRVTSSAGAVTVRPFNQAGTAAVLTVCDSRGWKEARAVIVSSGGRARISETDGSGGNLACP